MTTTTLKYDYDHLEALGRKDGILYVRKGYSRNRDLLLTLLDSIDRTVVLVSVGRELDIMEEMEHQNLRSIIRVQGNDANRLINWSDDMETFRYVASSLEKSILLATELAQRGDVILFSPYGNVKEVKDWFSLFNKNLQKVLS